MKRTLLGLSSLKGNKTHFNKNEKFCNIENRSYGTRTLQYNIKAISGAKLENRVRFRFFMISFFLNIKCEMFIYPE